MKRTLKLKLNTLCLTFATGLGLAFYQSDANGQSILERQNEAFQSPYSSAELPAPTGFQEGIDVLTQAPLHEAFAELPQESPLPNPFVSKQPPAPIEELPAEYRPEGANVQWIPGYWNLDEERNDFIWISGIWRDVPPGQRWVPGYWEETPQGYRWINGFWIAETTQDVTYLPEPPAPLEVGPSYAPPSDDYIYSPGCWVYTSNRYVWQPGYYQPQIANYVWVQPTYIFTPCGYVYRPGYWDLAFENRGVVFAPVYFSQPIYHSPTYCYTPTCVINTSYDLLPYLFVRNNCRNYYFGDWYGDVYARRGYCNWSQISVNINFRRCHDPLFTYYNHSHASYQNQGLMNWVSSQYQHCAANSNYRPSRTFQVNLNLNSHSHGKGQGGPQIANLYNDHIRKELQNSKSIKHFEQLNSSKRVEFQKQAKNLNVVSVDRRKH
ncbi:MAG: hypothetical protein R3C03_18845 [Pirellulaceae bacterium]